jgi:putative ABC transport system substrate-binding protein
MNRREFITLIGGATATWPLVARAQQPRLPVIGYLSGTLPPQPGGRFDLAFRQALRETGFVEGQNVIIEYRSAQGRYERLPEMASDLVRRQVAVIYAAGAVTGPLAAKAATRTIPIVFAVGSDPIELGLVTSLSRPGGNVTGVTSLGQELFPKRLELLREMVPNAATFGLMVNPSNPNTEPTVREAQTLALAAGWRLQVVEARNVGEIESGFANLAQLRVNGFLTSVDDVFTGRYDQLVALAARHQIPAIFSVREAVEAGGLMS